MLVKMSKKHFPYLTPTDMNRTTRLTAAKVELSTAFSAIQKKHGLTIIEAWYCLADEEKFLLKQAMEWELIQREKQAGEYGDEPNKPETTA